MGAEKAAPEGLCWRGGWRGSRRIAVDSAAEKGVRRHLPARCAPGRCWAVLLSRWWLLQRQWPRAGNCELAPSFAGALGQRTALSCRTFPAWSGRRFQ